MASRRQITRIQSRGYLAYNQKRLRQLVSRAPQPYQTKKQAEIKNAGVNRLGTTKFLVAVRPPPKCFGERERDGPICSYERYAYANYKQPVLKRQVLCIHRISIDTLAALKESMFMLPIHTSHVARSVYIYAQVASEGAV